MKPTAAMTPFRCAVVFAPKQSLSFLRLSPFSTTTHKPLFQFTQTHQVSSTHLSLEGLIALPKSDTKRHLKCGYAVSSEPSKDGGFIVVNFYHFVFIQDPELEVSKHLFFLQGFDIHGRVYINEQGINAQFSGPSKDALAYVEWLREDHRFSNILVQISPASNGHAFPKLKLRYKTSLVQLEGGISHLPLIDPSMRATALGPSEWRKRLEAVNKIGDASKDNSNTNCILLDVRNARVAGLSGISNGSALHLLVTPPSPLLILLSLRLKCRTLLRLRLHSHLTISLSPFEKSGYEWDVGHFRGAQRPDVDCFRSTSFGQSQSEVIASDPLANVDKEKTDILMYCTGGIRCDVYSAILRQRGFKNLYTLKGGISHYLEKEGPVEWIGNLFVFDSRLSLPPSSYKTEAACEASGAHQASESSTFARCYICSSQIHELRHRNCANLDCNLLFLCCRECLRDFRGCCCLDCTSATRLRPILMGHQRYKKWHIYRDMQLQTKSAA